MSNKEFLDDHLFVARAAGKAEEVSPGVIVERRYFLWAPVLAGLGIALGNLPPPTMAAVTDPGPMVRQEWSPGPATAEKLGWKEFLADCVPMAQQLVKSPAFHMEEYLLRLAALAVRLKELPETEMGAFRAAGPPTWFGLSHKGTPFVVVQWRMEPGALLPAHNHPNGSVCTLGFDGEVRLRNFEIQGNAPGYTSRQAFRVRETHNELLTSGRVNTLTPQRDNIHQLQAGERGARGIDITTLHGKMDPFSYIEIEDRAIDPQRRLFEARWLTIKG